MSDRVQILHIPLKSHCLQQHLTCVLAHKSGILLRARWTIPFCQGHLNAVVYLTLLLLAACACGSSLTCSACVFVALLSHSHVCCSAVTSPDWHYTTLPLLEDSHHLCEHAHTMQDANYEYKLATDPSLAETTGQYFVGGRQSRSPSESHDQTIRQKLWKIMEEQTGITY